MVNRSIQQKILKMKRRGRHAVFSGATAKYAVRVKDVLVHDGEDKVSIKKIEVPVGPVSLSKQTISTGRGPDAERMNSYYQRVSAKSFMDKCDDDMGIKHPKYLQKYWDVARMFRIVIVENDLGRLELYFAASIWFLVDIDYTTKVVKRSREYGNKRKAITAVETCTVKWVEIHSQI